MRSQAHAFGDVTEKLTHSATSRQFPAPQSQPEVDAISRAVQRAPRQLLHALDPVAQGVTMAVELLGRPLPLPVALDEDLQGAHELAAVGALPLLDRREDGVAEQP